MKEDSERLGMKILKLLEFGIGGDLREETLCSTRVRATLRYHYEFAWLEAENILEVQPALTVRRTDTYQDCSKSG